MNLFKREIVLCDLYKIVKSQLTFQASKCFSFEEGVNVSNSKLLHFFSLSLILILKKLGDFRYHISVGICKRLVGPASVAL